MIVRQGMVNIPQEKVDNKFLPLSKVKAELLSVEGFQNAQKLLLLSLTQRTTQKQTS